MRLIFLETVNTFPPNDHQRSFPANDAQRQCRRPIIKQNLTPRGLNEMLAPLSPKKFIQLQEGRQTSYGFVGGERKRFWR